MNSSPLPSPRVSTSAPTPGDAPRRGRRWAVHAARSLLGLLFVVFGLNGFLNFIPPPPPGTMPQAAEAFAGALAQSGYMMPLVAGTQVLAGLLLLVNRFVPLALALLAPVVVNIVLFHVVLAPTGTVMAFVVLAAELFLAWAYRAAFKPMLVARFVP